MSGRNAHGIPCQDVADSAMGTILQDSHDWQSALWTMALMGTEVQVSSTVGSGKVHISIGRVERGESGEAIGHTEVI